MDPHSGKPGDAFRPGAARRGAADLAPGARMVYSSFSLEIAENGSEAGAAKPITRM